MKAKDGELSEISDEEKHNISYVNKLSTSITPIS